MKKILSIDFETNGLWGKAIAGAMVAYDENGEIIEKISVRLSDDTLNRMDLNPWVKENVIPELKSANMSIAHTYGEMMGYLADFYMDYKKDCEVLWHMGHVVEAFAFREMVRMGLIGEWDAPYTPIELSSILDIKGYKPDSVDWFVEQKLVDRPDSGSTHDPLYDCEVTYAVYKYINK